MGKKILYGIEDYARDKLAQESAAGRTAAQRATPRRLGLAGMANGTPGGSVYIKPATVPKQIEAPANTETAAAVKKETVQTAVSTAAGTTSADTPMTQREMMYQNVVNAINSASQNFLDVMNRKFQYDEKSSPLYSILQKQYEREAEKAAGQAYAASVANTGGYGSSYATMAGEAARRQVMAGLDDQQLALYEAAKQEFDAERQSALDWYNTAVGMRAQAAQMVEEEKLLNSAKSSGMNEDTYNLMIQAANEGWYDGTNKESVRARLNTIAAGNPEINVDAIMNQLTAETSAATTDAANQFAVNPTVSGAAELMTAAKNAGTWEAVQPEVSKSLTDAYIKDMETPGAASNVLGADQAAWSSMTDEERKNLIMSNAGAAARDGLITEDDYARILMTDVSDMAEAIKNGDVEKPATTVSELVIDWQNYRDMGYMSEETYNKVMGELAKTVNAPELLNNQAFTIGEHFADTANRFADWVGGKMDIDVPDWIAKLSGKMIDASTTLAGGIAAGGATGVGKAIGVAAMANGILSNFDWYRRTIGMTDDQEAAMKELLKHYKE